MQTRCVQVAARGQRGKTWSYGLHTRQPEEDKKRTTWTTATEAQGRVEAQEIGRRAEMSGGVPVRR